MAVGGGVGGEPHADVAAGARAVVHHHLLPQAFGKLDRDETADDVGGAARRERHDQPHRARGILLRRRLRCRQRKRKACHEFDAGFHVFSLVVPGAIRHLPG
jgi:hypothetical protein